MTDTTTHTAGETLKSTKSKCTTCGDLVSAEVIKVKDPSGTESVLMRRTCKEHGTTETIISSDARFYWLAKGNPANQEGSCCGTSCCSSSGYKDGSLGANALDLANHGTIEKLSTCLALIEIVDSCNLSCPTCFADSPIGIGKKLKFHDFKNITERIQGVIDRKGRIEIIQFSGGEPTIHPQLSELVEWVCQNPNVDYLVINTNGIRFANDLDFVERIGKFVEQYDNIQLYLQFDGPQEEGQQILRGVDLRTIRQKTIENCQRFNIPITLAMTVNNHNLSYLWETVIFGKQFENVRGVSFQPMFLSGRNIDNVANTVTRPITTADVILGLHNQSSEFVHLDDFTPLPCGDPNCATIGWLFRMDGEFYSPSKYGINIADIHAKLPDRINYNLEDLAKCGCEGTELGELMKQLEVKESNAFRLFVKPFMDEGTWDEDRIDRCCTHVIRPDGQLDSFCRYYAN